MRVIIARAKGIYERLYHVSAACWQIAHTMVPPTDLSFSAQMRVMNMKNRNVHVVMSRVLFVMFCSCFLGPQRNMDAHSEMMLAKVKSTANFAGLKTTNQDAMSRMKPMNQHDRKPMMRCSRFRTAGGGRR